VRQGFGGQEEGDVVEERRRVCGLRGWWPWELAISRDVDRDLKVFWAFVLVSLVCSSIFDRSACLLRAACLVVGRR
jgi:hypothetical protein